MSDSVSPSKRPNAAPNSDATKAPGASSATGTPRTDARAGGGLVGTTGTSRTTPTSTASGGGAQTPAGGTTPSSAGTSAAQTTTPSTQTASATPAGATAATPSSDTIVQSRTTASYVFGDGGSGSGLSAGESASAGRTVSQSLVTEISTMPAGQVGFVRVESLDNSSALTSEILQNLAQSNEQSQAADVVWATGEAAQSAASTGSLQAASSLAMAAMTQKTVQNLPGALTETDQGNASVLYTPQPSATQASTETLPASQRVQAVAQTFAAATAMEVPLAAQVQWPNVLLDGLTQAGALWQQSGQAPDALSAALMALYGRQVRVLGPSHGGAELLAAAHLANAPLGLPVVGHLADADGAAHAFVVLRSERDEAGLNHITILDWSASLQTGAEVHRTLSADAFVRALIGLALPDGRSLQPSESPQESALHALGLAGCCLTAGSGGSARAGSIRTRGAGGRGLLEDRCIRCPNAQALCAP